MGRGSSDGPVAASRGSAPGPAPWLVGADAEPRTSCDHLEGSLKKEAKLSVGNTLFQTVVISGDHLVPGAEQVYFPSGL